MKCQIRGVRIWQHNPVFWLIILIALALMAASQTGTNVQNGGVLDAVKKRGVLHAGIRFDYPPHSYTDGQVRTRVDITASAVQFLGGAQRSGEPDGCEVGIDKIHHSQDAHESVEAAATAAGHTVVTDELAF